MPDTRATGGAVGAEPASKIGIVSVAVGTVMLWRAIGAPSLGQILRGAAGLALICHGMSGQQQPRPMVRPARRPAESGRRTSADPVQRASDESFPASDAPSWTPTQGPARRH